MLRILTKIFIFAFAFALAFGYSCQEGAKEKRQKLHSAFVYCLWLRFRLRWGDFDFRFCYFLICYCYCYWVIIFIHHCFTVCVCLCVCTTKLLAKNDCERARVEPWLCWTLFRLFSANYLTSVENTRREERERRRSTNKKTAQEQCRSAQFDSLFALWLLIKSLSRYAQFLTASSPNFTISHPSNWLC